jgi:acyl-CoA dehydrogenase
MLLDAVESILRAECTPRDVRAFETGGALPTLVSTFAETGFFDLLAPEVAGGGAASMQEFGAIVMACGVHAAPASVVDTMASRLWLEGRDGSGEWLLVFSEFVSTGSAGWGCGQADICGQTTHLLGVVERDVAVLSVQDFRACSHQEAIDRRLSIDTKVSPPDFQAFAALLRAGMMAGAMRRVLDMTLSYANERIQFGKAIGRFQAIQHQLAEMAGSVAAASMAVETAFAMNRFPSRLACAVAKSRASEAAQHVASMAHAVHGAIGVTSEYDLQLYTRRLHRWRMAFGSEIYWNRVLGQQVVESGSLSITDFSRCL